MCETIAIHGAYQRGDLEALRTLLGNPQGFPNCPGPFGMGEIILEYAIYHSPVPFLRTLLELGADPNYDDPAGFPSLIAAISAGRDETLEIAKLLLDFGADLHQRGINDFTPLHLAAAKNDVRMIAFLLSRGADADARTRIDDYSTPCEEAERQGFSEAVRILKNHMARAMATRSLNRP